MLPGGIFRRQFMCLGPCDLSLRPPKWYYELITPWHEHERPKEPEKRNFLLTLHLQVYPAGSVHHLRRGEVKQYKMHRGCFALEYAVGEL